MGLFSKFTDTIFLKSDSELEKKVNALKELSEKYPNNEKIKNDLFLANKGLEGEKEIEYELKNANIGMYVLHDITFRHDDLIAQIDYIVITPAKQYFIECKNLIGNITVNNRGEFTRKYEYYGHKKEEGTYSPLRQAERHLEVYKKIWNEKHGTLDKLFYEKSFDKYNVPLVVMANPKNILNVKFAPKEIKDKIIRSDQLVTYLKKELENTKWEERTTKKMMKEIGEKYLEKNEPIIVNYEEKYLTNEDKKDDIKNKLIEFRTNKSKEKNIPAYYIFTNEEIDKILDKMPNTKEELKDILSDIKITYHGDEIIDIIKKNEK